MKAFLALSIFLGGNTIVYRTVENIVTVTD